jgi:hypothetical protein
VQEHEFGPTQVPPFWQAFAPAQVNTEQSLPVQPLAQLQALGAVQLPECWQLGLHTGVVHVGPVHNAPVQEHEFGPTQVPPFWQAFAPAQVNTEQSLPVQPLAQLQTLGAVQLPEC